MLKLKAKTVDGEVVNFKIDELLTQGNRLEGIFYLKDKSCLINTIELDNIKPVKLDPIEKSRTYTFPKGEKIRLENVVEFVVGGNKKHGVKTSNGKLHVIPDGWLHIEVEYKK